LTDKVVQWISHDLALKVSMIIDEHVNEENRKMIKQKDDKIDELVKEVREYESKIEEMGTGNVKLSEHVEEGGKSFINIIDEMKSEYIPTQNWNVVCILKKNCDTYTAIRCLSTDLKNRIRSRGLDRESVIFRMETPVGICFLSTLKCNQKIKSKIEIFRSDIKLNVSLEEFMEILMEHKHITEKIITESLTN
jgi:hypothetical protein